LTVKTDHPLGHGTLIIFSWGAPERLKMQLSHIGNIGQKVIWVDPLTGSGLPDVLDGWNEIDRIEAALASTTGEVELSRYSLPDLYSLAPPASALTSLMPGLKLVDTVPVLGITAKLLGKKLAKIEGAFQLVIDTPGDEHAVLDFLDKEKVLERVTTMVLRCGVEPFFKKSPQIKTLLKMLDARGFSLVAVDENEDPDWPLYMLKLDPRARLIQSLEEAGTQVRADLTAAREEAETLRADLEARTKDRDAAKKATEQAVDAQMALKADLEARTKERDAAKKATEQAVDAQMALKADLEARTKERDAAQKKLEAEQAGREKEIAAHAETRTRLMLARDEIRRAEGQIELIKDLLMREPGF
jgi:hypothetical protein